MKVLLQTSILGCPAKHLATVCNMNFYEFNRTAIYVQVAVVINNEVKVIFDFKDETAKSGMDEISFVFEETVNITNDIVSKSKSKDINVVEHKVEGNERFYTIEDKVNDIDVDFVIVDENEIANINTVEVNVNIIK